MLRATVVVLTVVTFAAAFVEIGQLEPKPEKFKNEAGCYMAEFDKVVPFGDKVASTKRCVEHHCGEDKVQTFGCSVLNVEPPLELYEEKEKPYPDCCPKVRMTEKK